MSVRVEISPVLLPAPGGRALLRVEQRCMAVFNVGGHYHAVDDSCPHQGSSLASGKLEGHSVQCPAHGLRFDLRTGCMVNSPALRIAVYPIQIEQGRVFVTLPNEETVT